MKKIASREQFIKITISCLVLALFLSSCSSEEATTTSTDFETKSLESEAALAESEAALAESEAALAESEAALAESEAALAELSTTSTTDPLREERYCGFISDWLEEALLNAEDLEDSFWAWKGKDDLTETETTMYHNALEMSNHAFHFAPTLDIAYYWDWYRIAQREARGLMELEDGVSAHQQGPLSNASMYSELLDENIKDVCDLVVPDSGDLLSTDIEFRGFNSILDPVLTGIPQM